jgi:hypothetical protein
LRLLLSCQRSVWGDEIFSFALANGDYMLFVYFVKDKSAFL